MKNIQKLHVIRLTSKQVATIVELLVKAGDFTLAQRVLAQASKTKG